jgi:hypothetical protein
MINSFDVMHKSNSVSTAVIWNEYIFKHISKSFDHCNIVILRPVSMGFYQSFMGIK